VIAVGNVGANRRTLPQGNRVVLVFHRSNSTPCRRS
jgi:hypothetical protein